MTNQLATFAMLVSALILLVFTVSEAFLKRIEFANLSATIAGMETRAKALGQKLHESQSPGEVRKFLEEQRLKSTF